MAESELKTIRHAEGEPPQRSQLRKTTAAARRKAG